MSTAYSGVDAPGTGVFQLIAGLEADYGVLASHPDHLRAIEINSHCQTELSVHPSTPQCIFGDLEDFLLPRLKRALPQMLEEGTVASELRPLMMSDPEKSVLLCAYCSVHKKQCSIPDRVALVHVAGTSCTDYSQIGLKNKEQGKTFSHFLIWVCQRKLLQEPIVVQENVCDFPSSIFKELLPEYEWTFGIVEPVALGWPINRPRQWAVGRHRSKTLGFRSLLTVFAPMFNRQMQTTWDIFFWENDEEQLQAELDWACRRPTARWSEDAPCKVSAANAFENALTEGEFGFLLGYQEKVPGGIYSLNQSPFVMCVGTNQPVQVSAP